MTFSHALAPLISELMQNKQLSTGLSCGLLEPSLWPGQWQNMSLQDANQAPFTTRFDLAVACIEGYTEGANPEALPLQHYTTLLTKLRDLMARYTLVALSHEDQSLMSALGYSPLLICDDPLIHAPLNANTNEQHTWSFWQFNIAAYKQKPDWLNARFWANPENFDKFRW